VTGEADATQAVAVIGLGRIGGGMAKNLLRAGRPVTVVDVSESAVDVFRSSAATIATSPGEAAAQCDTVLIAVADGRQVEDVLLGPDGVAAARRPVRVAVHSTIARATFLRLAGEGRRRALTVVDASITGPNTAASAGRLVTLVGGTDTEFSWFEPVFAAFSERVLHMGPLGAGLTAKIARNTLSMASLALAYEASRLALAAGVDVLKLEEAIRISDKHIGGLAAAFQWMSDGSTFHSADHAARARADWTAGMVAKDLSAALELAAEVGIELPLVRLAEERTDTVFEIQGQPDAR
jgi:3-hydroxyisobutyrate dehydrogenase-like beta-hydroxyacid dehydrogenase